MGIRSTVKGYWRQRGSGSESRATPAPVLSHLTVTFDGAAANTTATGKWLPKGAVILHVDIVSAHTGGTTPAYDIGLDLSAGADPDAIVNGAVSTTTQRILLDNAAAGAEFAGAALTEDAQITAGDDGTGTAGTGNITAVIVFGFDDDGKVND